MKKIIYIAALTICAVGQMSSMQAAVRLAVKNNFYRTIKYGTVSNVKYFLDQAADQRALANTTILDHTPLHWAIALVSGEASEGMVRLLLDAGAEVGKRSHRRSTPLHAAALKGDGRVVAILLEAGAEVNSRDVIDSTPLHTAVLARKQKVAELLLDAEAKVNSQNDSGWTPLHWAARNGDKEMTGLLLDAGADANITTTEGKTPSDIAAANRHQKLAELLQEAAANQKQLAEAGEWRPRTHWRYPLHMRAAMRALVVVAKARRR